MKVRVRRRHDSRDDGIADREIKATWKLDRRSRLSGSRFSLQALPEILVKGVLGDNWERLLPYRAAFFYKKHLSAWAGQ